MGQLIAMPKWMLPLPMARICISHLAFSTQHSALGTHTRGAWPSMIEHFFSGTRWMLRCYDATGLESGVWQWLFGTAKNANWEFSPGI